MPSTAKLIKKNFTRNNKVMLIFSIVSLITMSFLNLGISVVLKQILDCIGTKSFEKLVNVSTMALVVFLLMIVFYLIQRKTCATFIRRAITQYKEYAVEKLFQKSIASISKENTARFISLLSNDVTVIESNYISKIFNLIIDCVGLIGAIGLMIYYSPKLTIVAVMLALLPVAASLLYGNKLGEEEQKVSNYNEGFIEILQEILSGFSILKSFRGEKEMLLRFKNRNEVLEASKYTRRMTMDLVVLFAMGASVIAQLGIFLVAAFLAISGEAITPGTVLAFMNLMNFVVAPVESVPTTLANRKASMELIDKLANILRTEEETGQEISSQLTDGISIQNLYFAYQGCEYILKDINLKIEKNKKYAVVGFSGSGKSTLLNLLIRSCENYEGNIRIDGKELSGIRTSALYHLISVVEQNVYIFNTSILENITMFKKFPKEELQLVIRLAGLSELIDKKGMEYLCGEKGENLSGGEKQRISIARCLLHETQVLLMDEVTAALDPITAVSVFNAILNMKQKTEIVVTHYLEESILTQFDTIIMMSDGRICEMGSFKELMDKQGAFYSLYELSKKED